MSNRRSKVIKFLQRLGKAMMTPIATLPAAGLMVRLGQADIWGQNLFNGNGIPWLIAAGDAIIGQMPLIFAIGIAIGLADDNDGVAGLAAAIGYFVFTKVQFTVGSQLYPNIVDNSKFEMGILAGVMAGIIAAVLYNKYKEVRVPQFLGFFGGKRFIPIITTVIMLILGLLFGYVWPNIQEIVSEFGTKIASSGAIGAFGFGFLNRLLIPFGLHHILNSVFWFQFGEYETVNGILTGDILRFLNGDPTAGIFQTGFFPIMMFALPAACIAMIVTANKEKRKNVAMMLGGLAFTSFLTGITEPIEFTFIFLSPVLYLIHAILTGLSMAITYLLGMRLGFNFSAGFIDYILNFNLGDNVVGLLFVGLLFGVIYFSLFYFFILKFNMQTPGREIEEDNRNEYKAVKKNKSSLDLLAEDVVKAVGGVKNIQYIDSCVTRIRLTLKDCSVVDKIALKKLGATNVIKIGDNIQIIIGTNAERIVTRIKRVIL